jgi:hypothetical protein
MRKAAAIVHALKFFKKLSIALRHALQGRQLKVRDDWPNTCRDIGHPVLDSKGRSVLPKTVRRLGDRTPPRIELMWGVLLQFAVLT